MRALLIGTIASTTLATVSHAAPIGRWWAGYGQGNLEYAIKNDSAGSDYFYISCMQLEGTGISLTVGGKNPTPQSLAIVTIGADEFELPIDDNGYFGTTSRLSYDIFRSLWSSIRAGRAMRVRLSTGESTSFTLAGAAKTLPREHCQTDFER